MNNQLENNWSQETQLIESSQTWISDSESDSNSSPIKQEPVFGINCPPSTGMLALASPVSPPTATSTPTLTQPVSRDHALEEFRQLLLESFNLDISQLYCNSNEQSNSTTPGAPASFIPLSRRLFLTPASANSNSPTTQIVTRDHQPSDFFIYSEQELQTAFGTNLFYLQTSEENHLHGIPSVDENFAARVIDPVGEFCNVEMRVEPNSSRISCSFFSTSPGIYTAEVRLHGKGHVAGSPLKIKVSRGYNHSGSNDFLVYKNTEQIEDEYHGALKRLQIQRSAWGIAYNPVKDELCIADRKFSEILTRSLDGDEEFRFGGRGKFGSESSESLCVPTGLAFDSVWNRLIIVDRGNHRVCFFTPKGKFLGSFGRMGHGNGEFLFPWDVAVSPNGARIAVTDTDNGRVQVFDPNGIFIALCSSPDTTTTTPGVFGHFGNLKGIAFDPMGENIYCADAIHNKIFMLSADLTKKKTIQLGQEDLLKYPQGVAVDKVGNILICDSGNNCIRVVTKNGTLLTTRIGLGCNGVEDGPLGVTTTSDGTVVAVSKNERLFVF